MKFTMQQIEKLQKEGNIRGYSGCKNKNNYSAKPVKNIPVRKKSTAKEWIALNLSYWCNEHAVTLETEYRFHPARKYRFDHAITAYKIAIEYEGIFKDKHLRDNPQIKNSVHSSVGGVIRDIEKYNLAVSMGWRVIRLTAVNYKTVFEILNSMI